MSSGALFRAVSHAQLLFRDALCLRKEQAGCVGEDSPWYVVTHGGVDAMMRRLVEEATLLAMDNPATIAPDASNTRCVRKVLWALLPGVGLLRLLGSGASFCNSPR